MITELLLINVILTLIFLSGFWDVMDAEVNKRVRFGHLPHILRCLLCQCWWASLIWVIATGHLSLFSIALCLINAHLTEITTPLITTIKNWMLKIIEIMMPR